MKIPQTRLRILVFSWPKGGSNSNEYLQTSTMPRTDLDEMQSHVRKPIQTSDHQIYNTTRVCGKENQIGPMQLFLECKVKVRSKIMLEPSPSDKEWPLHHCIF